MRGLLVVFFLTSTVTVATSKIDYFPKHAFGENEDQFATNYYGTWLSFFNEPSLLKQASEEATKPTYRFLWLRTFHHAIVIRLDVAGDGTGNLVTKVASGEAGFGMPNRKIIENTSRQLSRMETQTFLQSLSAARFWSIPGHDATRGNDGSEWVIEGEKNGQYHAVARWTPCTQYHLNISNRREICSLGRAVAFDLAHMYIPKDEIY